MIAHDVLQFLGLLLFVHTKTLLCLASLPPPSLPTRFLRLRALRKRRFIRLLRWLRVIGELGRGTHNNATTMITALTLLDRF